MRGILHVLPQLSRTAVMLSNLAIYVIQMSSPSKTLSSNYLHADSAVMDLCDSPTNKRHAYKRYENKIKKQVKHLPCTLRTRPDSIHNIPLPNSHMIEFERSLSRRPRCDQLPRAAWKARCLCVSQIISVQPSKKGFSRIGHALMNREATRATAAAEYAGIKLHVVS